MDRDQNHRKLGSRMQLWTESRLEELFAHYGFEGWAARQDGKRIRCPHGLLIGLSEECPVGCVSPLVVLGMRELEPLPVSD